MTKLTITVKNKRAVYEGSDDYVCGNGDYVAVFRTDEEWDSHPTKTARFLTEDGYRDVVFTGDRCSIPMFRTGQCLGVGLYAGDLRSTTAAIIRMRDSILSPEDLPENPEDEKTVYQQLSQQLDRTMSVSLAAQESASQAMDHATSAAQVAKESAQLATSAEASAKNAAQSAEKSSRDAKKAVDEFDLATIAYLTVKDGEVCIIYNESEVTE